MIHRTELSNGIRVVTETIAGTRSVSVGTQIGVGSTHDPVGKSGLAHFAEHSLFQGTSGRTSGDISRMIDQAGGHMSAFTGRDYTCLNAHVMQDYTPIAVDLLSDMVLNSTSPEEHLARERKAIINEIKLGYDDPFSRINDHLRSRMFPGQPHGLPTNGTIDSVSKITREDILLFLREEYLPDRLIIAAAGAIDHESFVDQVRDGFWHMLGTSTATGNATVEYDPVVSIDTFSGSQSYFGLAIPTVHYQHSKRYEVHALTTILGGGLSSRLYRTLREERGIAYYIQATYHAYRDIGLLWIEGVVPPDELLTALTLIQSELHDLASHSVDEEELWKTKMQLRGQFELSGDSTYTRMSRLATQELYFKQPLGDDEVLNAIDKLESASVQEIAQRFLRTEPSCVVLGPKGKHTVQNVRESLQPDARIATFSQNTL